MLRYKTETRPGLVALYDIRPGNGAGPFLQPRSRHGAIMIIKSYRMVSSFLLITNTSLFGIICRSAVKRICAFAVPE